MTTRILLNAGDRESFFKLVESYGTPCTVNVKKGKDRTPEQNRLQRLWCNEAAEQLGDRTAEEIRGYCKLHGGVPILREESDEFCEVYDRIVRELSYEKKLALMMVPLDMPITRIMTTKQKSAYLDWMYRELEDKGVRLTIPAGADFYPRELTARAS